jgi:hypothetical protein
MKNLNLLLMIAGFAIISSCHQVRDLKTLQNCEFKLTGIDSLNIAGINLTRDMSIYDKEMVALAILNGHDTLNYTVKVMVKNPNDQKALLNKMEIKILKKDIEVSTGGNLEKNYEINPGSELEIPLRLKSDISNIAGNIELIKDILTSLSSQGGFMSIFTIKIKPSVVVGKTNLMYPGFITLSTSESLSK